MELIARGERARALAERWPAERGFDLDPEGWWRLLHAAEQEPEQDSPASAAVWEALWRDDPDLTPAAWASNGPQPPGGEPLNPFLDAERYSKREASLALAYFDRQAGSLLHAAIRAESIPRWWDTPYLLAQYGTVRAEASRFLRATGLGSDRDYDSGTAFEGDWHPELSPLDPQLPPNRLEDIQVALTRLLLIGHSATTAQILPPLLASIEGEPSVPLEEQTRIAQFAMQRFGAGRRAVSALRSVASAGAPTRLRPARPHGPATPGATMARARTITPILLGTLLGSSSSARRRARRKDKAGPQPLGIDS
jgi:hypothetical protein